MTRPRDASQDPELVRKLEEAVREAQRRYVVARVGRLPAGPMADSRTHRRRDRGAVKRAAIEDQEPLYDLDTRSWDKTCPCILAEQRDPECPWHGREAQQ